MSGSVRGWHMVEHIGMGIPNPRSVFKKPIPPEMVEKWKQEAAEQDTPFEEYVDNLFARMNELFELDEAIKHAEDIAQNFGGVDNECCRDDHTQLAKWLRELRAFKFPEET